jgi:hypothetical protein
MSIEELEKELKDVKADAYDMSVNYNKLTQKISDIEKEIDNLKNNSKEEVKEETSVLPPVEEEKTSIELPQVEESKEEVKEDTSVLPPVEEEKTSIELPQVEESKEEIKEDTSVLPPVEEKPTQTIVQNEEVSLAPLIPIEENTSLETQTENKSEDIVSAAPTIQGLAPLTPQGVEIPTVEEKKEEKNQYTKTDTTAPKAILINAAQAVKLKKSKEQNKSIVFNSGSEQTVATVTPIANEETASVVTPIANGQVAPASPVENKEDINKQLESMIEQLKVTTDEQAAAKLNNDINVLSKKLSQAA